MTPPIALFDPIPSVAHRARAAAHVRRRGQHGFTLIEMLVTIGILLVLMGIVTVGLGSLIGGNQRKQTETILKRAQSFTAEINNTKQARESFYQRVIWTTYGVALPPPGPPSIAPVSVQPQTPTPTFLIQAVTDTVEVTSYLMTFKVNRDAALKLSPRNIGDVSSSLRPIFSASTDGQLIANVLLDAWGNPIIFVPDAFEYASAVNSAVVLPARSVGGLSNAGLTTSVGAPITTGGFADRVVAPDRRPFWFSAGPDGRYETHDDNVYSFN